MDYLHFKSLTGHMTIPCALSHPFLLLQSLNYRLLSLFKIEYIIMITMQLSSHRPVCHCHYVKHDCARSSNIIIHTMAAEVRKPNH